MSDIGDVFEHATAAFEMQRAAEEKPLFIPLKTEWFRQFEAGIKDTEYRAYGPRWNEKTCRIGRKATVSHGYSGKRLHRVVTGFRAMAWDDAPEIARRIFPDAAFIAAIHTAPAPIPQQQNTTQEKT